MKERFHWSDNTMVRQGRDCREFLVVGLCEPTEGIPYTAYLSRYCVPGRCDTYHFDISEERGIRYSAERLEPLPKMLAMLHADLEKKQVVALLKQAVGESAGQRFFYARSFVTQLLANLAPKSAAYRACRRAFAKLEKERKNAIESNRAARREREHAETLAAIDSLNDEP